MNRLTFDGLFCDLAVCQEVPCKYPDTGCSQRQVWERLKAIEDILGDTYDLDRLRELVEAEREGRWVWMENGQQDWEQYWVCSECGEHSFCRSNYCPDCGARMDLEVDHV